MDIRNLRRAKRAGLPYDDVAINLVTEIELIILKKDQTTMSPRELIALLTRVSDHLRARTPLEQLSAHTNEQLKRDGKPNGGEAPRLLVDIELEILKLQRQ